MTFMTYDLMTLLIFRFLFLNSNSKINTKRLAVSIFFRNFAA